MNSDTVINVERLNVSYDAFPAVKDLTLDVQRGELYALLGTNGAGKTSTLEVIEGHRASTSGKVTILGGGPTRSQGCPPAHGHHAPGQGILCALRG